MRKLKLLAFIVLWLMILHWIMFARTVDLGTYRLTRYYSPTAEQKHLLPYEKSKIASIEMNCGWNSYEWCETPADGGKLTDKDIWFAFACPPTLRLGQKIKLVFEWWEVIWVCRDRGWSIKWQRLDSRCGYWDEWVNNIKNNVNCYTGKARVYKIIDPPLSDNITNPQQEQKEELKPTGRRCLLVYRTKHEWSTIQIDNAIWQFINWIMWVPKNSKVFECFNT